MSHAQASDTRRIAFIFPGQGSHAVGMGRELAAMHPAAARVFQEADEALGSKLSQICFEGPEDQLRLTEITQPAILTSSVAALRVLEEHGIVAGVVAGHSLGEWSAHVAAGTLPFADAVRTVRNRGKYMQQAVPVGRGAMAAVLGMELEPLQQVCNEAAQNAIVAPANINSPGQIVISGDAAAVERAAELAKSRGAKRVVTLPVSAPFHCALMQPAQDQLADDLAKLTWGDMRLPLITNVDATLIQRPEEARDTLTRQVTGAVQWERCMRALIARGVDTFIEVGPGKVLCGLMRQIDRGPQCLNVEDEASLHKVLNLFSGGSPAPHFF